MRTILLKNGGTALVDDCDYLFLSRFMWREANSEGGVLYAVRGRKCVTMHRQVVDLMGASGLHDHRDGNGLNNQRSNLRPASKSQNLMNRKCWSSTGYKGVRKLHGTRYVAVINVSGERLQLGRFYDSISAAKAYDAAARAHFGAFASVNFPVTGERSCRTGIIA